jgi:hypothetical protein
MNDQFLCGDPIHYARETSLSMTITDASDAVNNDDLARLQHEIAQKAWAKNGEIAERLARAMLEPVRFARTQLPKLAPALTKIPPSGSRQRRPGGGRKPNEAKAILAAGVEQAMKDSGLSVGRWHQNGPGEGSPYLQAVALAWRLASGDRSLGVDDVRRLVAKERRWKIIPSRPASARERRRAKLIM